jgi:ribosomal-protein-alanine N-acetyltransferase
MITRLESPSLRHRAAFLEAVARSRKLHGSWVTPPNTPPAFAEYLERLKSRTQAGYFIRAETGELAGVINISEIVRGSFLSGYLGYYAFVPHNGRGYMTQGLEAVLREAFRSLRLHRLEANIQPGNEASRRLVQRLGFRQEGFSPRYLKIAGRWRDHERWALTVENWTNSR